MYFNQFRKLGVCLLKRGMEHGAWIKARREVGRDEDYK